MAPAFIVVTDLDGSLLDHESYAFTAALPALKRLEQRRVPLVLNSSKTAAELRLIRSRLNNHEPFIVENGAAIYFPDTKAGAVEGFTCRSFGMNRAEIVKVARRLRDEKRYQFTGFSEMSAEDLMACTGLDADGAGLALERHYTEPLLWRDSEKNLQEFMSLLQEHGISLVRGGRFAHLSSHADKGKVISHLKRHYAGGGGAEPGVIALGDSDNDIDMLERADYPVLVRSPVRPFPPVRHPALVETRSVGPAGWNEAVNALLDRLIGPEP